MVELVPRVRIDIIARDSGGRPVAAVEVKAVLHADVSALEQLSHHLLQFTLDPPARVPFALLVDLTAIRIYKWTDGRLDGPLVTLSTDEVLRCYAPNYPPARVFSEYLTQLVSGWLNDVAFRWKHSRPPGIESLERIGLADALKDGEVEQAFPLVA